MYISSVIGNLNQYSGWNIGCDMDNTNTPNTPTDIHISKLNFDRSIRYINLIMDALTQYNYLNNEKVTIFGLQPCLNGNDIKNIFTKTNSNNGITNGGSGINYGEYIGSIMSEQTRYQLNHPNSKQQCITHLKTLFHDLL